MQDLELKRKANISVREAMGYLYEIHRPLIAGRGGVGSDTYAEAYGNRRKPHIHKGWNKKCNDHTGVFDS